MPPVTFLRCLSVAYPPKDLFSSTPETTDIALTGFRKALDKAVAQRGPKHLHKCLLIFYFEDDDTHADDDAKTLHTCLQTSSILMRWPPN